MSLRVGIIGAGIMGADHARNLHRFVSGAHVAAIADPDQARAAAAIGGIDGAAALADPFELIASDAVDAVVIASPDALHADHIRACVDAAKPALCEKPLAHGVEAGAAVIEHHAAAVGDGHPLVYMGFMRRFDPGYLDLREAIHSGTYGRPLMVHSVGRGVTSGPGSTNESVVYNSAIHDLDLIPWLLDSPVTEVSWQAGRTPSVNAAGLDDPSLILVRTLDGALSTAEIFVNARYGYDIRCDVVCENGAITLAEPNRTLINADFGTGLKLPADWRPRFADAYRLELQEWVDAVLAGRAATLARLEDAATAGRVAQAVVESMHEGGAWKAVA